MKFTSSYFGLEQPHVPGRLQSLGTGGGWARQGHAPAGPQLPGSASTQRCPYPPAASHPSVVKSEVTPGPASPCRRLNGSWPGLALNSVSAATRPWARSRSVFLSFSLFQGRFSDTALSAFPCRQIRCCLPAELACKERLNVLRSPTLHIHRVRSGAFISFRWCLRLLLLCCWAPWSLHTRLSSTMQGWGPRPWLGCSAEEMPVK